MANPSAGVVPANPSAASSGEPVGRPFARRWRLVVAAVGRRPRPGAGLGISVRHRPITRAGGCAAVPAADRPRVAATMPRARIIGWPLILGTPGGLAIGHRGQPRRTGSLLRQLTVRIRGPAAPGELARVVPAEIADGAGPASTRIPPRAVRPGRPGSVVGPGRDVLLRVVRPRPGCIAVRVQHRGVRQPRRRPVHGVRHLLGADVVEVCGHREQRADGLVLGFVERLRPDHDLQRDDVGDDAARALRVRGDLQHGRRHPAVVGLRIAGHQRGDAAGPVLGQLQQAGHLIGGRLDPADEDGQTPVLVVRGGQPQLPDVGRRLVGEPIADHHAPLRQQAQRVVDGRAVLRPAEYRQLVETHQDQVIPAAPLPGSQLGRGRGHDLIDQLGRPVTPGDLQRLQIQQQVAGVGAAGGEQARQQPAAVQDRRAGAARRAGVFACPVPGQLQLPAHPLPARADRVRRGRRIERRGRQQHLQHVRRDVQADDVRQHVPGRHDAALQAAQRIRQRRDRPVRRRGGAQLAFGGKHLRVGRQRDAPATAAVLPLSAPQPSEAGQHGPGQRARGEHRDLGQPIARGRVVRRGLIAGLPGGRADRADATGGHA